MNDAGESIDEYLHSVNIKRAAEKRERFELATKNRRLAAERDNWPAGVIEACEAFDAAHPDWRSSWRRDNTCPGFEHPAGFFASFDRGQMVCGVDIEALDLATKTTPLDRHHSWHGACCELVVARYRTR